MFLLLYLMAVLLIYAIFHDRFSWRNLLIVMGVSLVLLSIPYFLVALWIEMGGK